MGKKTIHVGVEDDVYAMAKASGANISNLCNNFLRNFFLQGGYQEDPMIIRQRIEHELLEKKQVVAKLESQLTQMNSKEELARKSETEKIIKEQTDNFEKIKRSGIMDELTERAGL